VPKLRVGSLRTSGGFVLAHVTNRGSAVPPGGHWSDEVRYRYDGLGQLVEASNGAVQLCLAYDSLGELVQETLTLDAALAPGFGSRSISRRYDLAGHPTGLVFPEGNELARSFDAAGRLESLQAGAARWQASWQGPELVRVVRGNGVATALQYTGEGLPEQMRTGVEVAGGIPDPLHREVYTWTASKLRRSILREDSEASLWVFGYDGLGRLASKQGVAAVRQEDPLLGAARRLEHWSISQADELLLRQRQLDGRQEVLSASTNALHQVTKRAITTLQSCVFLEAGRTLSGRC
jgi:YD repeat-containing protein